MHHQSHGVRSVHRIVVDVAAGCLGEKVFAIVVFLDLDCTEGERERMGDIEGEVNTISAVVVV